MLDLTNTQLKVKELYRNRCNTIISYDLVKIFVRKPKDAQQYEKLSDLIFFFRASGENILITERIPRDRYPLLIWLLLLMKYTFKLKHKKYPTCVRNILVDWEFIDITLYDAEWFEFLKGDNGM